MKKDCVIFSPSLYVRKLRDILVTWQGFESLQIESQVLRLVTVPELGGKIVSIFDKRRDYEWLVSPTRPLRPASWGSRFSDYDLSGWDEMFPTINACEFVGVDGTRYNLPDHGELWTQAWATTSADDTALSMCAYGVFQSYKLERRLEITDADTLYLDYTLTSQAEHPFPFIWAAHPLFRAFPESRLSFTPPIAEMMLASALPRTGFQQGQNVSLATIVLETGEKVDILRVGQPTFTHSRKFYVPKEDSLRSVGIEHPQLNTALDLSWSGDSIRYFGLWIDEGARSREYVLAPEPCTGFYDDLRFAQLQGTAAVIQPGQVLTWTLRLRFNSWGKP